MHPNAISDDYYPPTLPYIQRVRYNPELLKARRKSSRLTLRGVGERAGVFLEAVAKLEGKDTAKPETVRRVCRALGLNPRDVSPAFKIIPSVGERELYMEALGEGAFGYPEGESIYLSLLLPPKTRARSRRSASVAGPCLSTSSKENEK